MTIRRIILSWSRIDAFIDKSENDGTLEDIKERWLVQKNEDELSYDLFKYSVDDLRFTYDPEAPMGNILEVVIRRGEK